MVNEAITILRISYLIRTTKTLVIAQKEHLQNEKVMDKSN